MFFKKNENKLIKELEQEIDELVYGKEVNNVINYQLERRVEKLQAEVDFLKLREAGYEERLKAASNKEVAAIEMATSEVEENLRKQEAHNRLFKKFEEVCQKLSVEEEQNKRWEQEMGRLQEDYNSLKREYRKLQEAIPSKPQPTATIKVDTKEIQEMLDKALQEIKEEYYLRLKEEPEYEYWFEEKWSSTRCQVCESPQQLLNRVYAYVIPNYGGILTLSEGLLEMVTRKKPKDVIIETYSETPVEIYSTRYSKLVKVKLCRKLAKGVGNYIV
ncbi:hypothetical protein [Enterococcus phage vB_EfaS_EF1c55]|nr:hypothetical protein [Enterococcus phage vB_EfaS_EF1c55]